MKRAYKKRFSTKDEKEKAILFSLVESYILENKPIGSSFLKESILKDISSATIRNYFSKLEKDGFLQQLHTSGGRIPTDKAYRAYVDVLKNLDKKNIENIEDIPIDKEKNEQKELFNFLNKCIEILAKKTNLCAFISTPRFDQDFIQNIKLVKLDKEKILCIVITDFGIIKTETLYLEKEISNEKSLRPNRLIINTP